MMERCYLTHGKVCWWEDQRLSHRQSLRTPLIGVACHPHHVMSSVILGTYLQNI